MSDSKNDKTADCESDSAKVTSTNDIHDPEQEKRARRDPIATAKKLEERFKASMKFLS